VGGHLQLAFQAVPVIDAFAEGLDDALNPFACVALRLAMFHVSTLA
jgi:hypothetical protein